MKKFLLYFILSIVWCIALQAGEIQNNDDARQYSAEARPWVWWFWLGNAVTEDLIDKHMDAYAKAGYGGVVIIATYGVEGYEDKQLTYRSDEWYNMVNHTLKNAKRLNMKVDLALSSAWPFGGKQVVKQDGAKFLKRSLSFESNGIIDKFLIDDKDNEYISDTQLSILKDNRTSLSYLLKNSTFGTAPGTFPEASKEILNNAIAELDQLITKVKGGEMFDEATFEATIAKVNQAIDEFKNSKYYNLSPEAQKFISDLMAKADELREMIANEALWGNHQGQYPVEGKATLESAAEDLESLADRIKTSAITDMTQEIYDDAIAAADKKLQEVENSAWPEDNLVWNLFVDGNKGGYIDFGYSEDFVKFGDDNNQNFTIELWINIKEFCSKSGEDNSTFLAAFVNSPRSGWRVQYRKVNGGNEHWLRGSMAHWQNEGPKDPEWWEPRAIVNNPKDKWTHFAFAVADNGVPGFDPPQEHTKSCVFVNGSQSGEVIRVGEAWRTYINNGCIEEKMPMTAFCRLNTDKTTREEYFSGYIKYMRIWKGIRSRDDLRLSAMGQVDVDPNDPNLVAAWDFEVLGAQPTGTTITDITGRHVATLKGPEGTYQWVESTTIAQ